MRMCRAMTLAAVSSRLQNTPMKVLELDDGDIAAYGGAHTITVNDFLPRKLKAELTKTSAARSNAVKQAIDVLMSPTKMQDRVEGVNKKGLIKQ